MFCVGLLVLFACLWVLCLFALLVGFAFADVFWVLVFSFEFCVVFVVIAACALVWFPGVFLICLLVGF